VDVDYRYGTMANGEPITALYEASERGSLAKVKLLLQAGADVNAICLHCKWTALHAACYNQHVPVVEELLKAGANPNMTSANGETPLLCLGSCIPPRKKKQRAKLFEIARLLLEAKCDVNVRRHNGRNAMSLACLPDMEELAPLLVQYGATVPAHAFLQIENTSIDKVALLLEHGLNVNVQSEKDGFTALHFAAARKRVDLVQLLLDHNANVSIVGRKKKRSMLMAAILRHVKYYLGGEMDPQLGKLIVDENQLLIVRLLLERIAATDKSLLDHQDSQGFTALHFAAQFRCQPLLQEILNWGPKLTLQSRRTKETALHSTLLGRVHHGHEHDDNAQYDQLEKLKCLMEHTNGYSNADDRNLQDQDGRTVLQFAVTYHRPFLPIIEYLSGVVDVRIRDVNGNTALHLAAMHGLSEEFLTILLRGHFGMEAVNIRNNDGRTALMEAVIKRNTAAVMALCPVTDIDNTDVVEGKTALHYAVQLKQSVYVDLLLERDANIRIRDVNGHTVLALACCWYDFDDDDDDDIDYQLSMIFQLYRYGVAYGEHLNMV